MSLQAKWNLGMHNVNQQISVNIGFKINYQMSACWMISADIITMCPRLNGGPKFVLVVGYGSDCCEESIMQFSVSFILLVLLISKLS